MASLDGFIGQGFAIPLDGITQLGSILESADMLQNELTLVKANVDNMMSEIVVSSSNVGIGTDLKVNGSLSCSNIYGNLNAGTITNNKLI